MLTSAKVLKTKVLKRRRTYNAFVEKEALEDYSLRYAAKSFRKWPEWLLVSTSLGGISFLALEAIGALLIVNYGFTNSLWALLAVMATIFITGLPITYYAAKYNVDIDLLTRGAGFGYIGSTVTSLIYAGFTFIFFAAEAAIMAQALKLCFGVGLGVGYVICSVVVIPMVFFGITLINKIQLYTQPLWIALMVLPYGFILYKDPQSVSRWLSFGGNSPSGAGFDPLLFGAAMTVAFSLIAQIGEQVDYLRFLPDKTSSNARKWNLAVILAGPGWIIIGGAKLFGGAFLAALVIHDQRTEIAQAIEPVFLYLNGFRYVFKDPLLVLTVTTIFVVVSQIKINITNAYAGSLAWSNFFSRITHSHPGRVVWLIFNVLIALLLMQFGFFFTLKWVLGVYANVAIAWIGAIVADLVILKPIGISPPYIEFKRAHLYKINPVGFGAIIVTPLVSIPAYFGVFGAMAQAFSSIIAFALAMLASLLIALLTRGKYYIARPAHNFKSTPEDQLLLCAICGKSYETRDMTLCLAYDENICSLCCSLDIRCKDSCKHMDVAGASRLQEIAVLEPNDTVRWDFNRQLKQFIILELSLAGCLAAVFGIFYFHAMLNASQNTSELSWILFNIYIVVLVIGGISAWWLSLSQEHRRRSENELDCHIVNLEQEISEHKKTTAELEKARRRTDKELAHRKRISKTLRATSQQRKLILENTTIGIACIKKNKIVWHNTFFAKLAGVDEAQLAGLPTRLLCPNDETYSKIKRDSHSMLSGRKRYKDEILMKRGEGVYWCRLVASALNPDDISEGAIWLIEDISERKQVLEDLRESEDQLKRVNENLEIMVVERTKELERSYQSLRQADKMASLGILVAGMAHEINNPIGFIKLNSRIISDALKDVFNLLDKYPSELDDLTFAGMDYEYTKKSMPKLLQGVQEGTDRISKIVSNLRDYSRQTPIKIESPVDINQTLEAALSLLSNTIKNATYRFEKQTEPGLPTFHGDHRAIEQVLINLVHNSCQALTAMQQSIRVSTFRENGNVVFQIQDEGVGVSPENLRHVLDPFFTTKRKNGGTGLGLSISSGIIEKHNGSMQIETVENKGTKVTLKFPIK